MTALHIAILSPFALAFLIPLLAKNVRKIHTGWFVLVLPVLLFIYFFRMIKMTADGGTLKAVLEWIPSFGINFTAYVDGLGLLFALLITGIGSLVVLYSIYYLSKEREQLGPFYVYLLMFMGAMLGVVLVDNVIVLYLFWELTSISSFCSSAIGTSGKNQDTARQNRCLSPFSAVFPCLEASFFFTRLRVHSRSEK